MSAPRMDVPLNRIVGFLLYPLVWVGWLQRPIARLYWRNKPDTYAKRKATRIINESTLRKLHSVWMESFIKPNKVIS